MQSPEEGRTIRKVLEIGTETCKKILSHHLAWEGRMHLPDSQTSLGPEERQ